MKKGFKKLLALVLTVFTFALAGVLYGCGDPYKDARITITTPTSMALSIDASGNAESTVVSVKVSGMPEGSSSGLISKEIDKDIAIIDEDSVEYNPSTGVTSFRVVANKGGEAKLVVRAEGGKQATASIVVDERLRSFSFNETYKPTIFIGKAFSIDSFGLNFENETATNKNVNIDLQRATNNGYVTVAALTNGNLTRNQTALLSSTENYYLRATTVDGGFTARKKVAVVEEIDPNEISIYLNNSTDTAPVKEITLATNIDSLTSKTFYADVNGKRNLKYEFSTDETELICKVSQDAADQSVFTVTKQNRGISKVTVRVGYEDSFDYYSVTKDYKVEVYSEPKNILINGLSQNENSEEELNVFSADNEWQLVDLSIDPTETNYKDVIISFLSDDYRKGYFRFGVQNTAGGVTELCFVQNGDYVYATYNSVYNLYVSVANKIAAANNEGFNISFTSERNTQATKTVKFSAREQIVGFNLTNGVIKNVDANNDGNPVDIIFAPINSAATRVEFSYETGYGDIILNYNQNRISASEVTINRETKSGYFTISGNANESVSTLNIYNGDRLQTSIVVIAATATNANVQVGVNTNKSLAILTDKNEYRDTAGYDRYIVFNNEAGTAPVEIKLSFSDEQASLLNYSVNIEKVNEADINEISYINNVLLVANKTNEAKAYLTFKLMYFVSEENNTYKVKQFDYKILINYSPELAEDMIAFAYYQNDKAITYAELLDYTTAGDRAEAESILDLEVFVVGDDTGSFFTIKSVECVVPTAASKYLTVKNNLTASSAGRFRFQILAGGLERTSEQFVLTFNILQEGRTQKIEKQFVIIVNKLTVVTGIALDPTMNVSTGGNGGNGEIYSVMQMGENGETENLAIVNANNTTERVSFNSLEVNAVSVEPNDYSVERTNDALPIVINNGVITRVGEGAAKITIKLKSTATLNKNVWVANGDIEYVVNNYNSLTLIVKCYGVNVAKDIFSASDFAAISANGKFTIANNIDLTGVKLNLARFNAESELDGNNYILYGLNQNSALFNANYGTIKNINLIVNQTITNNASALSAICVENRGVINNVSVNGTIDAVSSQNFVYGAVAAENYASITNSKAEIVVNVANGYNGKAIVGAVCGVNNGTISGDYIADETATETTPDISLTVNNMTGAKANFGGVAGKNNGYILNVKAEAIINGSAMQNVVAGGVAGVDSNGDYYNLSGSLITDSQILSGGLVIGRANNNILLSNVKGVARLNVNSTGEKAALDAFSATYAGGIIGEAYQTITITPSVYVVGFVLSEEITSGETTTTNTYVSQFSGDYAGGIVGKVADININTSETYSVSFEDVNIIGTTSRGLIAGSVGAEVRLDDSDEDNYVFNAYYQQGVNAYELTTEATGNTAVKDANNNNVYVFVDGVKTQLYYNASRPIYDIVDDYGIYTNAVTLGVGGQTVDFGYKVYSYNNIAGVRGQLIENAYAKLNLVKGTASGSPEGGEGSIGGGYYDRTYTLITNFGSFALTEVSSEYLGTICSYTNGGSTQYIYIKEDETLVATNDKTLINVEQNEYYNYITSADATVNGSVVRAGTLIAGDTISIYDEESLISFGDSQVYTYVSKPGASSVEATVVVEENSAVMLNGAELNGNDLTAYYFGEQAATSALASAEASIERSARRAIAKGAAFNTINAKSKAQAGAVFAAAAVGGTQATTNEPEFIIPENLENGQGVKSNYISTLGENAVNGEIYGISTTEAINSASETSEIAVMYVLLDDTNSTTIFDLSGLINNLRFYNVNVYSENNIAKLYASTLVVNGAGTIALTLTPYSSLSSTSYIMLIRVAQKPNASIYTKTISGQTQTINNGDNITLTSGSEFEFYADNVMSPVYSVSGNGNDADEIEAAANRYVVKLKGSSTEISFNDSVNFASETINVAGAEYAIGAYTVKYREWTFNVNKGYNLEFVSANLSSAQITKNEEVYLTLKIKVYGYVQDVSDIIKKLDFVNEVIGGSDAPELAYQILNHAYDRDANANTTTITINVLYYIADKNVEISSGYNANIFVKASQDVFAKVELKIVPQTITYLSDVLTPLYGKQIYTEGSVIFDKVAAEVVLTPAFFYNDVSNINVSASVAIEGEPDKTYGTTIVSATGATLNGKSNLTVEKKNVVGDANYNKFVFYVYISSRQSVDSEAIKKSTVTLTITWGKNNEYSQVISYKVSEIPDLQFDTSVPYYAIGGNKELTVVNSAGEKINNLASTDDFYGFGVEAVNGVLTENAYNAGVVENAGFGAFYLGSGDESENYYIRRDTATGAGTFVSSMPIGTNVTLGIYATVDIGNGTKETLLINRFKITIVLYTIESIEFTTPSGLQPLDQEIPIDFNVNINYNEGYLSADEAKAEKQKIIEKLMSYWSLDNKFVNDNTARYIELWYKGKTADGADGESILRNNRGNNKYYYYGIEGGSAKFLVIPKLTDDKNFAYGYRIWGTAVNTPITIELRTFFVYNNGIPELQIYNTEDHSEHIMLKSEFNFEFYQLSTEENPTPINTADQFINLLSNEASINEHFRLMTNITLSNYSPIAANFASLDGNGYVIYIESFAADPNATGDISLGLFSYIGENTLVKNISIAVGRLLTFGGTAGTLSLENYSSVTIGLITPENHGYIANCEVVNFDFKEQEPVNDIITISTSYGAETVVGGLVAHNYGSVVNSRVGRSLNSDYKYLGYFTISDNGATKLDPAFELANETEVKENGINIAASGTIGGLVAYNHKTETETGIISSCYFAAGTITNNATVVETSYTGGLVAFNEGQIALSSVEGQFSNAQKDVNEKDRDLLVRQGAGISSNGNIGGFVYNNSGTITDCYSNITLNTQARSAAFVYNTKDGTVDNAYAFSSSSSTTNNAPFVGLEPFESVYEGTITNSYYFTLSSADVTTDAEPDDNLNNTDLITKIPDASTARIDTTYTSLAFSQVSYNERGEEVNAENGVWKFSQSYGPILTSANSIAVSKYVLKTTELDDVAHLQFNGEQENENFDLSYISNASGYMAVSNKGVGGVDNFEINNYIFIKNAAEFNDRILNGENEYQSKVAASESGTVVNKKVYRLISNITFGASGNSGATIGTSTLQFEGILDGNGLNINNLVITDTTIGDASATTRLLTANKYVPSSLAVGMFASMANGAAVKNLNLYVRQVAASNTDVVGSLVGILENSYVYNVKVLPYGEESENRVSGSFVAAGAIGMVLGDATSFKIANVSSSVSVAAVSINMPKIEENATAYNKIENTVSEIYGGFDKETKLTLNDLYYYDEGNKTFVKNKSYSGLSIAAGVIGVTDVKTDPNDDASKNFVSQINNGTGNNVRLAQISRISAGGNDLRLTARNAAGVIGIVDKNVFAHDIEFVVSKFEGGSTQQKIGGTLTIGGISIINSGLIKYARIAHENQYELDRTYLSAEAEYNYAQNSARDLFALTKENDIYNIYVGGITAINNVGEIVDSFVKVDVMPTVDSTYSPNGYAGFAAGLSVGGRISYFYSLADIDGQNFKAGLIGYATENKLSDNDKKEIDGYVDFSTIDTAEKFREYQQEITKKAVSEIPYIVVNTVTIIVPTDASLASTQYNNYYTLAGYAAVANVFGDQTDKDVGFADGKGYNTTLKNINYTNIGLTFSSDNKAVDKAMVGGSSKNKYYMQTGKIAGEEYYEVNSNYENEGGNLVLNYSKHGGGADYKTIVNARAAITFRNFLETLRWNVFNIARMPFPFYGISQNMQYIKEAADFAKLALYPDNVFVIQPNNPEYVIEISSRDLNNASKIQFAGILTGREGLDSNGKPKKPTIKLSADAGSSIFNSTLDASIYNFNVELETSGNEYNITRGLFGEISTNTLFENIDIFVKDGLKVNAADGAVVGLLINNLTKGSIVRNVNVEGRGADGNAAVSAINISGNGSFGAIAGEINASVASFAGDGVSNLTLQAINTLTNAGGAFGRVVSSTIAGLGVNNIAINATSANVGGAIGYAELSNFNTISVKGANLIGNNAGGVVGQAKGTTIKNSYAIKNGDGTGNSVKAAEYAGGFAGRLQSDANVASTVSYSFSSLNVYGTGGSACYVGGFAGLISNTVTNCYATGNVENKTSSGVAGGYAGGFAGAVAGSISNCYSTGSITAASHIGGFIARVRLSGSMTISNSFTLSRISDSSNSARNFIRGGTGTAGRITNCYYASELNNKTTLYNTENTYKIVDDEFYVGENESGEVGGVEARSLSKFFTPSSNFTIDGLYKGGNLTDNYVYTFRIGAVNGTPDEFIKNQTDNEMLKARVVNAETGSISGNDLIYIVRARTTATTKGRLASALTNKIVIGAELASSAATHATITDNTSLFGTVENSIITNLKVSSDSSVVTNAIIASRVNNSILNKIIVEGSFTGSDLNSGTGALAGRVEDSLILNSHNSADINSEFSFVGGLVGILENSKIIACYNSGDLSGKQQMGGLVGLAYSGECLIYKSYNTGKIFGSSFVAGIVGNLREKEETNVSLVLESVYNTGLITGTSSMAGLVYAGSNATLSITNAYNSGAINNATGSTYYYPITNRAASSTEPRVIISNVYYNSDLFPEYVAGDRTGAVGEAKTTEELVSLTFTRTNDFELYEDSNSDQKSLSFPLLKGVGGIAFAYDASNAATYLELGAQIKGTGANLYQVSERADLVKGGTYYPTASFIVVNDFSAEGISDYEHEFTGTIYGCNHTIYWLTKSLLATAENATISNLRFSGTNISDPNDATASNAGDLGAPIANEFNGGFISNVIFTGELNAHLVSEGDDTFSAYAGGIVAKTNNSTMLYCNVIETDIYQYFTSSTTSGTNRSAYIGGVVGKAENSYINKNTYSGNIYLGRGFFENGVGFGDVTKFYVGGVVGNASGSVVKNNIVQNQVFYANGMASGMAIDKELKAGLEQTLAISGITVGASAKANVYNICEGANTSNDYTRSTSLQNNTVSSQTFNNINDLSINSTTKLGATAETKTIADLVASIASVAGLDGSTYKLAKLIYNADGFNSMTADGYYKLVCNIDSVGEFYNETAPKYFDGRGYVVSDVTSGSGAMFGTVAASTTFKNVVLNNATITSTVSSSTDNSGVLAKVNNGTIKYVGIINSTLDVTNASDSGEVKSGTSTTILSTDYSAGRVGCLVGYNSGKVAYSYSMAQISVVGATSGYVGGLVGLNYYGTVAYSYGSGLIAFPYIASTGSNGFTSSGAVGIAKDNAGNLIGIGTITNVFANSEIMIAAEEKNNLITRTSAAEISINMFNAVANITQDGTANAKNAGMPMLARHKNFANYRPYAFNFKAKSAVPTGSDIVLVDDLSKIPNDKGLDESSVKRGDQQSRNKVYCLTNNIVLSKRTNATLLNSFGGKLYFNGYSILGYEVETSSNNVGLFRQLCLWDAQGSNTYDASIINPKTTVNINTNSIMSTTSANDFWSGSEIYVGVLAANSCHGTVHNANILGGFTKIEFSDFTSNGTTTITRELKSKSITLPTVYIDAFNPGNKSNVTVNNGYAYSSSIYVKTARVKTQNVQPDGDKLFNLMPESTYKSYFPKNPNHNFTYSWQSGFYQEKITNDIQSGDITLSPIVLSTASNSANNIISVLEDVAITGSARVVSSRSNTYMGTGNGVQDSYNNLMNYIKGSHTLGDVKTGSITGVKVTGASNAKIKYTYSYNTGVGTVSSKPSYTVRFEWRKKDNQDYTSLGSATYNITNDFQKPGSYNQAVR